MHYSAFISYNHADRKVATWLHRALESYRIPDRLRGHVTPFGPLGARMAPVFRDRDELAASADLAASVQQALGEAASLVVICSPNAAASRWVNAEIRAFTALGRRHRIFCLIIAGVPNASRTPGADPALECLPPALFEAGGSEPMASDIRPGQDGRGDARLKLVAGILDLEYDSLRQREAVRRHRRLAAIAAASATGFVLATLLSVFALISRQQAIEQRDLARRKTLTAERTVDFVKSIFAVADPSESRGETVTAREILDAGAVRIERELNGEPSVKAALGTTLGETYTSLGLLHRGEAMITRMLAVPGVDPGTRVRQLVALGSVRDAQADDAGAAKAFGAALKLAEQSAADRADLLPRILVGLGTAQTGEGDFVAAERNIRAALAADRRRRPLNAADIARDLEALAATAIYADKLAMARPLLTEALGLRLRAQGQLHPDTIRSYNLLASLTYLQGDTAMAERYFATVLPLRERVLGRDHPDVAASLQNYARILIERRQYGRAEPMLDRALRIQLGQRDTDASDLAFYYANLGIAQAGLGQYAAAKSNLGNALEIAIARKHRNLGPILGELAYLACNSGEPGRGNALVAKARTAILADYPKDVWRISWLDVVHAKCLAAVGRKREARTLWAQAAPVVLDRWPEATRYGSLVTTVRSDMR